jgi:acyl-CoA reductase-like NAD-dependent aldehyde dehydrogenase
LAPWWASCRWPRTKRPWRSSTTALFGLTASLWTPDLERAQRLAAQLEVGTVFMNRCDYLDPELAWVGVRDSGRGCTLSRFGFDGFTRLKSLHLRHAIP